MNAIAGHNQFTEGKMGTLHPDSEPIKPILCDFIDGFLIFYPRKFP